MLEQGRFRRVSSGLQKLMGQLVLSCREAPCGTIVKVTGLHDLRGSSEAEAEMSDPSLETIKAQYNRLYASATDIEHAQYCAGVLVKDDWQHISDGRSKVASMVAYTTAMIVSYCRPFTESDGWPGFPDRLLKTSYDAEERALHQTFLRFRHSLYAHTDSGWYTIEHLLSSDGTRGVRSTSSGYLLLPSDVQRLEKMAAKLQAAIAVKMSELQVKIPPETTKSGTSRIP